MSLRTRIALTFLILLTAVLVAALSAVSIANRANAQRDVQRQLEFGAQTFSGLLKTNRSLLTQAAQAVADDYGFRAAVAEHDTETLISALQNSGTRVGAAMVVLTSLDGVVVAASGSDRAVGSQFPIAALNRNTGPDASATVMVDNGKTALEAWEGGPWDVILMDVQMPIMDGLSATRAIRAQEAETGRARTPIIALTANAMTHQVAEYRAAGMDGHVAKPIEAAKLFAALEAALGDDAQLERRSVA